VTTNKPPIHRNCPAPGVKAALIEERVWDSIWQLLTDPKRLLEIARDYFESLKTPDHNLTEALRQEAAKLQARVKRTQQMVRDAILDYDEGSTAIRTDKLRLEEIDRELHRAGRVIQLPSLAQAEAAVAEYRDLSPSSFEVRRDILESILDLKMRYADGNLEITGRVPTLSNSTHGVSQ